MVGALSAMILGLLMAIAMPKPASCAVLEEGEMAGLGLGVPLSEVQYEMRFIELSKLLIAELVTHYHNREQSYLM